MEITLKLGEVLNLNQSLKLIIDDTKAKIDPLFKFKLLGIMKAIESHVANFETIRNEKINEYGKENGDGSISIDKEDSKALKHFNEDILKIINSEVCVNISKLKAIDVFDKGVKAEYLMGLYPIIEE